MWNFKKLSNNSSPMSDIIRDCSSVSNLRFAVYHLDENHVECATLPPNETRELALNDTAIEIRAHAVNGPHAVLAYDIQRKNVYMIDSVQELNVASCVLLCVITDLLNKGVATPSIPIPSTMVNTPQRDERGRFTRATVNRSQDDEGEAIHNGEISIDSIPMTRTKMYW